MALSEFVAGQVKARPIEATMVRKIARALKAAGKPVVRAGYTYGFNEEHVSVRTENDMLEEVFAYDDSILITEDGSWVRLVMGQEYETLTDYTTNLEEALAPVSEWIDKNW